MPVAVVVRINGDWIPINTIEQELPTAGFTEHFRYYWRTESIRGGKVEQQRAKRHEPEDTAGRRQIVDRAGDRGSKRTADGAGRTVPIPELRQATGLPGDQSIAEKLTVTPPPPQLATDKMSDD